MTELEKIRAGMKPLFEKAEKENLWFYSNYQGLWFSPKELKKAQAGGHFNWGAVNWTLRDPKEELVNLRHKVTIAVEELSRWEAKLKAGGF